MYVYIYIYIYIYLIGKSCAEYESLKRTEDKLNRAMLNELAQPCPKSVYMCIYIYYSHYIFILYILHIGAKCLLKRVGAVIT
jgi:hypothetical protein